MSFVSTQFLVGKILINPLFSFFLSTRLHYYWFSWFSRVGHLTFYTWLILTTIPCTLNINEFKGFYFFLILKHNEEVDLWLWKCAQLLFRWAFNFELHAVKFPTIDINTDPIYNRLANCNRFKFQNMSKCNINLM